MDLEAEVLERAQVWVAGGRTARGAGAFDTTGTDADAVVTLLVAIFLALLTLGFGVFFAPEAAAAGADSGILARTASSARVSSAGCTERTGSASLDAAGVFDLLILGLFLREELCFDFLALCLRGVEELVCGMSFLATACCSTDGGGPWWEDPRAAAPAWLAQARKLSVGEFSIPVFEQPVSGGGAGPVHEAGGAVTSGLAHSVCSDDIKAVSALG